jgi:hypothetical protein
MTPNSTRVLPFSIADDTTPLAALVVDITTSDTNLFPAGSLVLAGSRYRPNAHRPTRHQPIRRRHLDPDGP